MGSCVGEKRSREEEEGRENTAVSLNKEDQTSKKTLSWMESAARAGVITMVTNSPDPVKENLAKKKKTAKESRQASPKVKENSKITPSDKKMFKESFNTDKARLEKRQTRYNRPQNFLLIVEDPLKRIRKI